MEVDQYYRAVEAAAISTEQKLKQIAKTKTVEIQKAARKHCILPALTLIPVMGKFVAILLWLALFCIYSMDVGIIFRSIAIGLYGLLVVKGFENALADFTRPIVKSIDTFAAYKVTFMHFGERESGDLTYPYAVIRAPWKDGKTYSQWYLDKKYGRMLDQNFIALHLDADSEQQYALIHMSEHHLLAQIIEINADVTSEKWPIHVDMMQRLAKQTHAEMQTFKRYAKHAEALQLQEQQNLLIQQQLSILRDIQANWSDIAIEEEILERILKFIEMFASGRKPLPKGILLYGPSGTGKTLIVEKIIQQRFCYVKRIDLTTLKADSVEQTIQNMTTLWQHCRDQGPTILFVDDCENAFARSARHDNFAHALIQSFCAEWDSVDPKLSPVFVIGATHRRDLLDNDVVARFSATIEIDLPNDLARYKILNQEIKRANLDFGVSEELIVETIGMSGRDIHHMFDAIIQAHTKEKIKPELLLGEIQKRQVENTVKVRSLNWDDIILPPYTFNELQNLTKELKDAALLAQLGVSVPKAILLYGLAGTGKTQIANILAAQLGRSIVTISPEDLKSNYADQASAKIKYAFEQAYTQIPSIVLIDEIDVVAGESADAADHFVDEVVAQLLQEMENLNQKLGQIFVLATSNYPANIHSDILLHLDHKIEIGLPDLDARRKIIALQLAKKTTDFDVQMEAYRLAELTEGYSGHDLIALVNCALQRAAERIGHTALDQGEIRVIHEDFEGLVNRKV